MTSEVATDGRPAAICQDGPVARFEPFPGIRYDLDRVPLGDVIAPPYDVIDDDDRADLVARHERNSVRIDLPADEDGRDRYEVARCLLRDWLEDGTLRVDAGSTFTVYRMSYDDDAGRPRHTTGVIGALELHPPGVDILPHEHTTPKAKSDRLDMLRSCRANLSAIWGLSLAPGLTDLLPTGEAPDAEATDDDGVTHAVWIVDDPGAIAAISAAVAEHPVVIADGHHRYETSLAYRREREADGDPGPAAATMAYVVELIDDELTVRAIHRLLTGLPEGIDLVAALDPWFEPLGPSPEATPVTEAMAEAGALCVVTPDGEVLVRPRPGAFDGVSDLDSSRLDAALAAAFEGNAFAASAPQVAYQHGPDLVRRAVAEGRAQAGVLLRPATVAQIEATAHGGERMPPKTTFFHPKPKTGLIFRSLG
jgi:uncharacterized protein (DUF1015 family)